MLVGHPGEEALETETVTAVGGGAVLALVGVPEVRLVVDVVLLVGLNQLVVVIHTHGATDDFADAGHWRSVLVMNRYRREWTSQTY